MSEYRIKTDEDDVIFRIDERMNDQTSIVDHLIVRSIVFIKVNFLENVENLSQQVTYDDIKTLFS